MALKKGGNFAKYFYLYRPPISKPQFIERHKSTAAHNKPFTSDYAHQHSMLCKR